MSLAIDRLAWNRLQLEKSEANFFQVYAFSFPNSARTNRELFRPFKNLLFKNLSISSTIISQVCEAIVHHFHQKKGQSARDTSL